MSDLYYIINPDIGELTEYRMVANSIFIPQKTIVIGFFDQAEQNLVLPDYENNKYVFTDLKEALLALDELLPTLVQDRTGELLTLSQEIHCLMQTQIPVVKHKLKKLEDATDG